MCTHNHTQTKMGYLALTQPYLSLHCGNRCIFEHNAIRRLLCLKVNNLEWRGEPTSSRDTTCFFFFRLHLRTVFSFTSLEVSQGTKRQHRRWILSTNMWEQIMKLFTHGSHVRGSLLMVVVTLLNGSSASVYRKQLFLLFTSSCPAMFSHWHKFLFIKRSHFVFPIDKNTDQLRVIIHLWSIHQSN